MKRLLFLAVLVASSWAGRAHAQIVLTPTETGTARQRVILGFPNNNASVDDFKVGRKDMPLSGSIMIDTYFAGVIEFNVTNINDNPVLPTAAMTSQNFTAKFQSLTAYNLSPGFSSASINVLLYDLADGTEDSQITGQDWDSIQGSTFIASRMHSFSGAVASFDGVDVTDEVRRDLFGASEGIGNSLGFLLTSPDAVPVQIVAFDRTKPKLVITVAGGDTDSDTDTDMDTDTDTDTDMDTDTDVDTDTDTDTDSDSDTDSDTDADADSDGGSSDEDDDNGSGTFWSPDDSGGGCSAAPAAPSPAAFTWILDLLI